MAFNHISFLLLVSLIGITEIVNDSGLIYPLVAYHRVSDVFPVRAKCRAKGKGSSKTLMYHMGTCDFGPLKSREESPLYVFKTGNFFISIFLFCVLHRDRVVSYCQVRDCHQQNPLIAGNYNVNPNNIIFHFKEKK